MKDTQNSVLSFIKEVAENDEILLQSDDFIIRAKENLQGKTPDYSQAILNLNKQRDANNGITWHEDEDNHIIVRDARSVKDTVSFGYESYAIQYLNVIRASKILLENAGKLTPKIAKELDEKARHFLEVVTGEDHPNTEKSNVTLLKDANKNLLDFYGKVAGVDSKTAKKQLNTAKDFANFEDTHNHVVTLSKVGEHSVFEADVALFDLTDTQKQQYTAIKDPKAPKPEWYKALPKWEQKLVQRYADKIMDGQHVIPTQLRSNTIGIRNAYNKITGVIDNDGNAKPLHQTFHGGTVASQTKGGNKQDIATMHVEQFSQHAGGKPVHCVTLNTPHNPMGNDKEIVRQTSLATEQNKHSHSNFAFNGLRRVGPNKYDGTRVLLEGIPDMTLDAIGQLNTTDDTKAVLKLSVQLRQLVNHNKSPIDPENRNLEITTLVSRINDRLVNGDIDTNIIKSTEKAVTVFMCQSGKDRTGVQLFNTSAEVLGDALDVSKEELRQTLANNGHTQQMAGFQGGSMGCMGIKAESITGMPKSWGHDIHHTLSQKTAGFNNLKTAKKSEIFNPPHTRDEKINVLEKKIERLKEKRDNALEKPITFGKGMFQVAAAFAVGFLMFGPIGALAFGAAAFAFKEGKNIVNAIKQKYNNHKLEDAEKRLEMLQKEEDRIPEKKEEIGKFEGKEKRKHHELRKSLDEQYPDGVPEGVRENIRSSRNMSSSEILLDEGRTNNRPTKQRTSSNDSRDL